MRTEIPVKAVFVMPSDPPGIILVGGLEHIQSLVDGDIESVANDVGATVYVNTRGGGMRNMILTMLTGVPLIGNGVVVGPPDEEGEDTDVPRAVIDLIAAAAVEVGLIVPE